MKRMLLILLYATTPCFGSLKPLMPLAQSMLASPQARHSLMKLPSHVRKPMQKVCALPFHQEASDLYDYAFDHTPIIMTEHQMIRIQYWDLHKLFLGQALTKRIQQGFHHDYLGEKEEEYNMTVTNRCKNSDCYQATWSMPACTKTKQSTFFPQHLTRKEVLELLFESMRHNFPYFAIPTNRPHIFMLKLPTPDQSFRIKVVVDTQEDMIKTFYPDIVWSEKEA